MRVPSLDQEDSLEKGMATHSSILAWRVPWTEESGGLTVHGVTKSWTQLSDLERCWKRHSGGSDLGISSLEVKELPLLILFLAFLPFLHPPASLRLPAGPEAIVKKTSVKKASR